MKPSSLAPGFVKCFEEGWKGRSSLSQLPCYLLSSREEDTLARPEAGAGLGAAVGLLSSACGEILSPFTCVAN